MTGPTSFDLLIFDCDGVLVDSEPLVNQVYVEMLGELGYFLDYDDSLAEFAGAAMTTRLQAFSQRFRWVVPSEFPDSFHQRLCQVMRRGLQPVPGIRNVLADLQLARCVASNGSPDEIAFRLNTCGLASYFGDAIFSGTGALRPKPFPDVFLAAAAAFGAAPTRCAVIEDSLPGVRAAVQAGMKVFGYCAHNRAQDLAEAGAITFYSMADLPDLLS